jgi:cytochrome c oxidase subunit 4
MSTPVEHEHHVVRPKTYLLILFSLLVLTATTTGVAYLDLGIFNAVVALAIACIKATLVVLFFMHLWYSSKLTKLTLVSGLFTFMVLMVMTLTDYISRTWGLW